MRGKRITVFLRNLVQAAIVDAEAEIASFLVDEEYGGGSRRGRAANETFSKVLLDVVEQHLLPVLREVVQGASGRSLPIFELDRAAEVSEMRRELVDFGRVEDVEEFMPFRRDELLEIVAFGIDGLGCDRRQNGGLGSDSDVFLNVELFGNGVVGRRVTRMVIKDSGLVILCILAEASRIDEFDVERWARRRRIRWSGSGTRKLGRG